MPGNKLCTPYLCWQRSVPWLKHQQNCWDLRWWNLPGGENSFVLLLDIFQAVQSEGAGSSLAVISVVILRKSVSSYAKDTEAKARPLPAKVLVLSMTLKNTVSLFFRTQLLWPEKLYSLLWTAEEETLLSTGNSGHPQRIIFYFLSLEILEYMHWEAIAFRQKNSSCLLSFLISLYGMCPSQKCCGYFIPADVTE